jgi:membrane protein YdbS with pleckstrin-like domain
VRALPTRKLDKRIITVWRLSALINTVLWSAFALVPLGIGWLVSATLRDAESHFAAFVLGWVFAAAAAVALVFFIAFVVIAPRVRWLRWSFEVGEDEIDIHKGIIWRERIIIPLIRVQNVDTKQGPILRANHLASFTVSTAAGAHEIPGLAVDEADVLRDRVALLARIAQEDV